MKGRFYQTSEISDVSRPVRRFVGKGDRLRVSYGIPRTAWKAIENPGTIVFKVKAKARRSEKTLFVDELKPFRLRADRGWQNADVSLDQFAGSTVTLTFSHRHVTPKGRSRKVSGALWGGLRIGNFKRKPGEPNIILVSLDTLRADHLSLYGHTRNTSPNIDQIAAGGVWFENGIAQSPNTKPSTMSMMTSLRPSEHGVWRPSDATQLSSSVPVLSGLLAANGYLTQAYTGSVLVSARYGFSRGFDRYQEYDRPQTGDGNWVFNSGVKFIKAHADEKFFLFLHTYEIHTPYRHRRFVEKGNVKLDDLYDGGVTFADRLIRRLWEAIVHSGIAENTVLVIVSDHGEQLRDRPWYREHGHSLYDDLLRVPFIFRQGRRFPPRKVAGFQAQHVDLMPTLLDLAGVDASALTLRGRSLRPILEGQEPPAESVVISEGVQHGGRDLAAIRWQSRALQRKFIFSPSAASGTAKPSKFRRNGRNRYWLEKVIPGRGREFYEITSDPREQRDLAASSPIEMERLEATLKEYLERARGNNGREFETTMKESELTGLDDDAREQLRSLGY